MSGFSWAAINFLWLVPIVIGTVFVAAALLFAVWHSYWPPRLPALGGREWAEPVEQGYAGAKPTLPDNRVVSIDPANRRRVP